MWRGVGVYFLCDACCVLRAVWCYVVWCGVVHCTWLSTQWQDRTGQDRTGQGDDEDNWSVFQSISCHEFNFTP